MKKYLTTFILGLAVLFLCFSQIPLAQSRVSRPPMTQQLSLAEIKHNCFDTIKLHQIKDARSKITIGERKILCLLHYSKLGEVNAQYLIGKAYAHDNDSFLALTWLKESFNARDSHGTYIGNPEAGFEMGKMFLDKYLADRKQTSMNNAYEWLRKSALRGSKASKVGLVRLYMKVKEYKNAYIWSQVVDMDKRKIPHDLTPEERSDVLSSVSYAIKKSAKTKKAVKKILSDMPIVIIHN